MSNCEKQAPFIKRAHRKIRAWLGFFYIRKTRYIVKDVS